MKGVTSTFVTSHESAIFTFRHVLIFLFRRQNMEQMRSVEGEKFVFPLEYIHFA